MSETAKPLYLHQPNQPLGHHSQDTLTQIMGKLGQKIGIPFHKKTPQNISIEHRTE